MNTSPDPLEFAVIDVETTGLSPYRGDRVVEIAVLRMLPSGEIRGSYESLVNPQRSVGATHIHGISSADVELAPTFRDIVPDMLWILDGAVLVAHNVAFDFGFLTAECQRAGFSTGNPLRLCTVRESRQRCPGLFSHKLSHVCRHLRIPSRDAHSAMADCRAAAGILHCFLQHMPVEIRTDLRHFAVEGTHLFSVPCLLPAERAPRPRRQSAPDSSPCMPSLCRLP